MRAILLLLALAAAPTQAAQVCGWIDEAVDTDNSHNLTLWFEADAEIDLGYSIGGTGISDASGKAQSPGSGNLYLKPGMPETPWMLGTSIFPPTAIDVIADIEARITDIAGGSPPKRAVFTFQRTIMPGETTPPGALAVRQCLTL